MRRRGALIALVSVVLGVVTPAAPVIGVDPGQSTGGALAAGQDQTNLVQDASWLSMKLSGKISPGASSSATGAAAATYAVSATLPTTVTGKIVEPEGRLYDDKHSPVGDLNYWNFCTAGGATAALYYLYAASNVTGWPAGSFKEPYGPHLESHWYASSDTGTSADTSNGYATNGRAYLMYLAEQVRPPSYSRPGILNFDTYPTKGGGLADVHDAMNWEGSGHAAYWSTFFYVTENPTEANLHSHVVQDISHGYAVVAAVNTGYLPNWSRSLGHTITIIGYDDSAGTYTYLDTCGKQCNGSSNATNGGTNIISQHNMYLAIHSWGAGIDW